MSDEIGIRHVDRQTQLQELVLVILQSTNGLEDPNPTAVLDGVLADLLDGRQVVGGKDLVGLTDDVFDQSGVVARSLESFSLEVRTLAGESARASLSTDVLNGYIMT